MWKFLRTAYIRDERGTMSIEAIFWLTLVAVLTAVFVDSAAMFNAQGRILRIVQDGNRAYSLGFISTPGDLEEYIENRLDGISPTANATVILSAAGTIVNTGVTAPATDFQVFGTIPALSGLTLGVASRHLVENVITI